MWSQEEIKKLKGMTRKIHLRFHENDKKIVIVEWWLKFPSEEKALEYYENAKKVYSQTFGGGKKA